MLVMFRMLKHFFSSFTESSIKQSYVWEWGSKKKMLRKIWRGTSHNLALLQCWDWGTVWKLDLYLPFSMRKHIAIGRPCLGLTSLEWWIMLQSVWDVIIHLQILLTKTISYRQTSVPHIPASDSLQYLCDVGRLLFYRIFLRVKYYRLS